MTVTSELIKQNKTNVMENMMESVTPRMNTKTNGEKFEGADKFRKHSH